MATINQKIVAQAVAEKVRNGQRVSISAEMRKAGYSPHVAKQPHRVTKSKGWHELCDELGLTDDLIVTSLVEDIEAKKGNRKPELELAAKLKGRLKERGEDSPPVQNNFFFFNEDQLRRVAARAINGDPAGAAAPGRLPDSDQPELHTQLAS